MRFARIVGFVFGLALIGLCVLFGVGRKGDSTASRIVFVREDEHFADNLFIMDADGGRLRQLTDIEGDEFQPTWSPDGEWIAFVSWGDRLNIDPPRHLYKIRADGSDLTHLTELSFNDGSPEWSPNGEWIAYSSYQSIYRMRPDGSDAQRLTPDGISGTWPSWSGNSEWVVFVSDPASGPMHRIRADGTDLERIVLEVESVNNLEWSPDGGSIVLSSGGVSEIYVLVIDGWRLYQLTEDQQIKSVPSWSPDSEWIVFASSAKGSFDLYKIRADGRDLARMTSHGADEKQPVWSEAIDLDWSAWMMFISGGLMLVGIGMGTNWRRKTFKLWNYRSM